MCMSVKLNHTSIANNSNISQPILDTQPTKNNIINCLFPPSSASHSNPNPNVNPNTNINTEPTIIPSPSTSSSYTYTYTNTYAQHPKYRNSISYSYTSGIKKRYNAINAQNYIINHDDNMKEGKNRYRDKKKETGQENMRVFSQEKER